MQETQRFYARAHTHTHTFCSSQRAKCFLKIGSVVLELGYRGNIHPHGVLFALKTDEIHVQLHIIALF